jgi:hypothetical protein
MGGIMKKMVLTIVAVLLPPAAYLTLWPVPIQPVHRSAPMPPGYTGPHAVNTKYRQGLSKIIFPLTGITSFKYLCSAWLIKLLDVDGARREVAPFLKDAGPLTVWSPEFSQDAFRRIAATGVNGGERLARPAPS